MTDSYSISGAGLYSPASIPAYAGLRANRFDPIFGLYNWKDTNTRNWRTALARASISAGFYARLNAYGDSITFGLMAAPSFQNSWVTRLRNRIDTKLGVSGGTGMCPLWQEGRLADDTRFVLTGAQGFLAGYGPFNLADLALIAGKGVTFSPDKSCDNFAVQYVKQTAAGKTWNAKLDGATIDTAFDNGTNATLTHATKIYPAGALGAHTLEIDGNGNTVYPVAIEAYNSVGGVRVSRMGMPSHTAADLAQNSATGSAGIEFAFDEIPPDLSLFFFGHNEYLHNNSIASYVAAMTTLINKAKTYGDVLLITTVPQSDQTQIPAESLFDSALYDLADTFDVPLLDINNRWGPWHSGLYADVTHPNTQGYMDISAAVYAAIMRGY